MVCGENVCGCVGVGEDVRFAICGWMVVCVLFVCADLCVGVVCSCIKGVKKILKGSILKETVKVWGLLSHLSLDYK